MLRRSAIILVVLILAVTSWSAVEIVSFAVQPLGDHARLSWTSGQEIDFASYIVERSSDGSHFVTVGQVNAQGSYTEYAFTDQSPLNADNQRPFYYRLKLINRDNTYSYSETLEVSLTFSAVVQTWGSIKAMFR